MYIQSIQEEFPLVKNYWDCGRGDDFELNKIKDYFGWKYIFKANN